MDLTCGSIIVSVAPGSPPVEVVFGNDTAIISIPAGATAEIDATPAGGFTVDNVSGGAVTVTVDGTPTSVPPGGSLDGNAWDFDGFKAPTTAAVALPVLSNTGRQALRRGGVGLQERHGVSGDGMAAIESRWTAIAAA